MSSIVEPTRDQLDNLVAPYLSTQSSGLGFAIGYASPSFDTPGQLYFAGSISNQFGDALGLNASTRFEIASVSKTFTATLYVLLVRLKNPNYTIGDFSQPNGPLHLSSDLSSITLDELMSYTSGLPQDNDNGSVDTPAYWPSPYSMPAMLSYLNVSAPSVTSPGEQYTYSNLAFAIMSAILASGGTNNNPHVGDFSRQMRTNIFEPLGIDPIFFNDASLTELPLGFGYDYTQDPPYSATAPGWAFFPAYYGAGGIVATPDDMLRWLLFNMGIVKNSKLSPLLQVLQSPATSVKWGDTQLGLGWFISPASDNSSASVWKDGDLDGFGSYIAFLPSSQPGSVASQAGAFVLVNAEGLNDPQNNGGVEIAAALTNDLLLIMQGKAPPADKSRYPRSTPHTGRPRRPA
jgi:D-alanyl-D-alanine-carboxypeptidase/D-alanyl-D-alanine-endopeptidase